MTTRNIYDKHAQAFKLVSAYVIMKDDVQQGTIAIKYPVSWEGRLTAYVHLIGSTMVSASCSGGNYDKVGTALFKIAKAQLESGLTLKEQRDFYTALLECNSGFDKYATYGEYKIFQAI